MQVVIVETRGVIIHRNLKNKERRIRMIISKIKEIVQVVVVAISADVNEETVHHVVAGIK